jgi:NAD(P)H-dependent FMN reductase
MNIPIILGTAREGRQSEKVANYVLGIAKSSGHDSEIVDARDYRLPATDNTGKIPQAKKLAEKINKADALIIVCPEYNHGYPGELKMLLDLLYDEYAGKKIGLCGVSMGPLGGARGLQALKLTLLALSLIPVVQTVYFSNVTELFDDQGRIKDPSYEKKVAGLIKALGRGAA